jgi:hypothetical protein
MARTSPPGGGSFAWETVADIRAVQRSIYQTVRVRSAPEPHSPPPARRTGTDIRTAQVMKDEAGRPFIIVRE